MFGIYGIATHSKYIDHEKRSAAFKLMSARIDETYFNSVVVTTECLSLGIARRNNHENKDIAVKCLDPNHIIAFSGYARIKGEKDYRWADEMIAVIVEQLAKNDTSVLESLEGSFECIICKDEDFLMISDRFGSKKQFIAEHSNAVLFAPDAGQIIAVDFVPKTKNLDAAAQLLISGFFLDDSTLDKHIERFPFATVLTRNLARPNGTKRRRYWFPPVVNGTIARMDASLVEELGSIMQTAIWDLQKLSAKTVMPLSGGLDSRAIACFLVQKQDLNTLTYDFGDEVQVARKVSRRLHARHTIVDNTELAENGYRGRLNALLKEQYFQAVVNQYFYAPLFYKYLNQKGQFAGLYDGVYMDILFSAPYTYHNFDYGMARGVYGRGIPVYEKFSGKLASAHLNEIMRNRYDTLCKEAAPYGEFDGVGRSQFFYLSGRLRRYVCETYFSRENYGYVFKPGFNYRLADFGFSLDLPLRKGVLYRQMLQKYFPKVMQIPYKDSYGNRQQTGGERIRSLYNKVRAKISAVSGGRLGYAPYQVDHYFLMMDRIDDLRKFFYNSNHIEEFFSNDELQTIFETTRRKFYYFNIVQRIQLINNFYTRFGY